MGCLADHAGRDAASHQAIRKLRGPPVAACAESIQLILAQCRRTESWPRETADRADAGIQAIRYSDNHDPRHRIGGKDQEGSVQDWKARRSATVLTIWAALDLSSQQNSQPASLRSVSTIGICTRPRRTAHIPELQEHASPCGRRSFCSSSRRAMPSTQTSDDLAGGAIKSRKQLNG
jgi:hypothetical protein